MIMEITKANLILITSQAMVMTATMPSLKDTREMNTNQNLTLNTSLAMVVMVLLMVMDLPTGPATMLLLIMESLRATNLTTTTQSLIKLIPLKALFYEKYFHSQFGLNVCFQHAKNYSVKIDGV